MISADLSSPVFVPPLSSLPTQRSEKKNRPRESWWRGELQAFARPFFFRSRAAYFFAPLSMDCKKKVTARCLNSMLPQADIFVILTSVTEHAFPHGNFLKNVYLDKLSIGGIYHSVSRRFNTLTKILPRLINSDNAVKGSSGNTASVSKSLAW